MKTEILVITDRSGSMSTIRNDVIGGFNTFIDEQKKVAGEARVTYSQFDDVYEVVYAGRALESVPKLDQNTYVPRGGTALLDAIGRTLNDQGARIAQEKWADLVVVCVITDGQENQSREFTRERVKEMTAHAEKNGWKFVYLAANQDAFAAAQNLGMAGAITQGYVANASGTRAVYATASASIGVLRSGGSTKDAQDLADKLKAVV